MTYSARIAPTTWEAVTGYHWFASDDPEDWPSRLVENEHGSVVARIEESPSGREVVDRFGKRYPLGVPLCKGCDEPLNGSVCDFCELVHADVTYLGDGKWRVAV